MVSPACRKAEAPPPADASHAAHPAGTPAARTTLLGNLGSYQRTITTANAEAQKFFDEGLTLLYGFNHEEAFRSFERAATLDPKAPMPHWGMSLALGTNYNDTATPDRVKEAHAISRTRRSGRPTAARSSARSSTRSPSATWPRQTTVSSPRARRRTRRRWVRCRSGSPTISMPRRSMRKA